MDKINLSTILDCNKQIKNNRPTKRKKNKKIKKKKKTCALNKIYK